ncbi:MAG: chorismate-binding protein, partial [Bacteroidota bacterium]
MTLNQFRDLVSSRLAAGSTRVAVPVFVRRSADLLTPVAAYLKLRQPGTLGFLLESVEGGEKLARYSFLGVGPRLVLEADGAAVRLTHPAPVDGAHSGDGAPQTETRAGSVYDMLGELLADVDEVKIPDLPRFTGGGVGYLGYDTVRLLERLPEPLPDPLGLPDALWAFYDTLVAFDHVRHQMLLIATVFADADTDLDDAYAEAQHRLARLEQRLAEGTAEPGPAIKLRADAIASNFARSDFEAAVETAKQHIVEGDIFQVVLSQRFAMPFRGDTFNLYRALRQVNPSPYLFYLDLHSASLDGQAGQDYALVGSSPEVLVRVEEGRAEVLPIAGTRKRGATPDEDYALETDLLADPKERAEHLMLVDLGRNDLGRVCAPGTVAVDRYAYVERYSHVMHIVSAVSGVVDERRTAMDVLGATFPAGTVSGAPKIRAMEIIDTLEPEKRGVYAGAVGYADYSGNMDTCIAIRTMVVRRDGPHHGTA